MNYIAKSSYLSFFCLSRQWIAISLYCLWGSSILPAEFQQRDQVLRFKRVPVKAVESFLKQKRSKQARLIDGEDVLVPADSRVIFNLNVARKKVLVQGFDSSGSKQTYKEFSFEQPEPDSLASNLLPDIRSGSSLSLLFKQKRISVQLTGRALEAGRIGDIINVRVAKLAKSFRVRITSKKRGVILL